MAHRSNTHVCISKQIFLFEYSACFLTLRGSWTTNWRTRTTLCLFLHFMEGRTAFSAHPLHSPPPTPHSSPNISTTHHLTGRCRCVGPHRDIWGDWCRSTGMKEEKGKKFCECLCNFLFFFFYPDVTGLKGSHRKHWLYWSTPTVGV